MGSLKRKLVRRQAHEKKKKIKKLLKEQLGLFNLIPEHCAKCGAFFDKTNREQVFSWKVRVQEALRDVQVYCPSCAEQSEEG